MAWLFTQKRSQGRCGSQSPYTRRSTWEQDTQTSLPVIFPTKGAKWGSPVRTPITRHLPPVGSSKTHTQSAHLTDLQSQLQRMVELRNTRKQGKAHQQVTGSPNMFYINRVTSWITGFVSANSCRGPCSQSASTMWLTREHSILCPTPCHLPHLRGGVRITRRGPPTEMVKGRVWNPVFY